MARGKLHSFYLLPEDQLRLELIRAHLTDVTPWREVTAVEVVRAALQITADRFAEEKKPK